MDSNHDETFMMVDDVADDYNDFISGWAFDFSAAIEDFVTPIMHKLTGDTATYSSLSKNGKINYIKSIHPDISLGAFSIDIRSALVETAPLPRNADLRRALARDLEACAETIGMHQIIVSYVCELLVEGNNASNSVIATVCGPFHMSDAITTVMFYLKYYYETIQKSIESKGDLVVRSRERGEIDALTEGKFGALHLLCENALRIQHSSLGLTGITMGTIKACEECSLEEVMRNLVSSMKWMNSTLYDIIHAKTIDELEYETHWGMKRRRMSTNGITDEQLHILELL
ncbi:hypothetical protein UCDDS831_g03902 [Diplodia seriata]|uniref:Uncharacterized protein n=1 Tax=Diplodia seriata TaxID=420778 RepID=A0A0G2EIM0_9PEZI|nr:hypothetical protein UCDDS831_g03902 [Diplodia seriata]